MRYQFAGSQNFGKNPKSNLVGVVFKLAQLNALLQLDPPDRAQVLNVHLALLDVVQKHLDPGLTVVLAVGHQVDPGSLERLEREKDEIKFL